MDPCESFRVWLVEDTSAVDMSEKDLMRIFPRVPPHTSSLLQEVFPDLLCWTHGGVSRLTSWATVCCWWQEAYV